MYLAQEFDAVQDGRPFVSAERVRVSSPDLRSRLYGYLATAPEAAPGHRTDGVWVWPVTLADHVRRGGAAPQAQLYRHIDARGYLAPRDLPESARERARAAVTGKPVPEAASPWRTSYFATDHGAPPARELRRVSRTADGRVREFVYGRGGWAESTAVTRDAPRASPRASEFRAISAREAALVVDQLNNWHHATRLVDGIESAGTGALRWAQLYDGEAPDGTPWFSARRLRIADPARAEELAAYLRSGRVVLKAAGNGPDPLAPDRGLVVPMDYRTDGRWIWPEALAYFVRGYGVAPGLEFLCHIEERGRIPVTEVPAQAVHAAVPILKNGAQARLPGPRYVYYTDGAHGVVRARAGDVFEADQLHHDLQWTDTDVLARQRLSGSAYRYAEISEAEAVRVIQSLIADPHAASLH